MRGSGPASSIVGCFLYRLPQKEERDCGKSSEEVSPRLRDCQRLPEIARGCSRLPEIARDRPRLLEVARGRPRLLEIARDRPRLAEIARGRLHPERHVEPILLEARLCGRGEVREEGVGEAVEGERRQVLHHLDLFTALLFTALPFTASLRYLIVSTTGTMRLSYACE